MKTGHGHLKLIDFGTAKIFQENSMNKKVNKNIEIYRSRSRRRSFESIESRSEKSFVGTLLYSCPEMINGSPPSYEADLWA